MASTNLVMRDRLLSRGFSVLRPGEWRALAARVLLITAGALITAISVAAFLVPAKITGPGAIGLATILNHLLGTSVGLVVLLINIPIMILAYRTLGGLKVILATIYFIIIFSAMVELLVPRLANVIATDNIMLMALFGGIVGGLGGGLIYRAGGTMGGTSTLARILQVKLGIPISATPFYTDLAIMMVAGVVFGWEAALNALVALFVSGFAVDYVLEGPSVIRSATIITDRADAVSQAILTGLGRGVTLWQGEGGYTGHQHTVLFVTVARPEATRLRDIVSAADPQAFIVITQGQAAYGEGFKTIRR